MSKKQKLPVRRTVTMVVIACLVVGLFVAVAAKAQVDQSFLDAWAIVKAKVEGLLAPDRMPTLEELQAKQGILGGNGETASTRNLTGLYDMTLKDSDSSEDDGKLATRLIKGGFNSASIASSTFESMQNTTSHLLCVVEWEVYLPGTASGTMRVTMGTSTVTGATTSSPPFGIIALQGTTTTLTNAWFNGGATTSLQGTGAVSNSGKSFPCIRPNEHLIGVQKYVDTFDYHPDFDSAFSTSAYWRMLLREMATSS